MMSHQTVRILPTWSLHFGYQLQSPGFFHLCFRTTSYKLRFPQFPPWVWLFCFSNSQNSGDHIYGLLSKIVQRIQKKRCIGGGMREGEQSFYALLGAPHPETTMCSAIYSSPISVLFFFFLETSLHILDGSMNNHRKCDWTKKMWSNVADWVGRLRKACPDSSWPFCAAFLPLRNGQDSFWNGIFILFFQTVKVEEFLYVQLQCFMDRQEIRVSMSCLRKKNFGFCGLPLGVSCDPWIGQKLKDHLIMLYLCLPKWICCNANQHCDDTRK